MGQSGIDGAGESRLESEDAFGRFLKLAQVRGGVARVGFTVGNDREAMLERVGKFMEDDGRRDWGIH